MPLGKRLLYTVTLDAVARSDRLRQIQTPGFMLPKRIKMGSCFFIACRHGLESRACPTLPVGFVVMFLLMLMTAELQWLHNFQPIAKLRKMISLDHSVASPCCCTMGRSAVARVGTRIGSSVYTVLFVHRFRSKLTLKKQTITLGKTS
jgi:hypothetical protein